jgi:hypothetical protein
MSVESAPGGEPVEAGRQQQVAVLLAEMVEDATVWCVVHELVVGVCTDPIHTPPPSPFLPRCLARMCAVVVTTPDSGAHGSGRRPDGVTLEASRCTGERAAAVCTDDVSSVVDDLTPASVARTCSLARQEGVGRRRRVVCADGEQARSGTVAEILQHDGTRVDVGGTDGPLAAAPE